ncbi:MAG: DUF1343 domain-containing protein [Verrucomicrobia bacterium]|nr:DUF1343 domain-containing protein [Verrucomicrobiota bacterium]
MNNKAGNNAKSGLVGTWLNLALAVCVFCMFESSASARVLVGSDVLALRKFKDLEGKRVGLLTNPSGINSHGQPTVEVLANAPNVNLVALFAVEHGIYGKIPAGKEFPDTEDSKTGLPVYSLYGPGPVRTPTPEMLEHIDVLVYDIQDTGVRSYTFISSMGLAMEACGEAGVEFMVLDRPNPLGGLRVEGPILEDKFKSLVGQWEITYAYGMTCGELARMINGEGWIEHPCKLIVIPMSGWRRDMVWKDTNLKWIPTSPNVITGDTPMYLAATGIIGELGGVRLGGGTPYRFQCIAAQWLDANSMIQYMNSLNLPDVNFNQINYDTREGTTLTGAKIEFTDPSRAPLVSLNLFILEAINTLSGRDLFKAAQVDGHSFAMFDKVMGTDVVRLALAKGRSTVEILSSWVEDEKQFLTRRHQYLIPMYGTNGFSSSSLILDELNTHATRTDQITSARKSMRIPDEYEIRQGDTLYEVSRKYGIPVESIIEMNPGISPTRLQVGQIIRLPSLDTD